MGFHSAAQAKIDNLQACIELAKKAEAAIDLPQQCPDVSSDLQRLGWLQGLEPSLQEGASLAQLEFLADAIKAMQVPTPINQNGLGPLLAGILIAEPKDPEKDWWQAVLKWLDSLKGGEYETEYNWLVKFFESISPSERMARYFLYGSIGLLVLISAWLVLSELVRAGVFKRLFGLKTPIAKAKPLATGQLPQVVGQQAIRELPPQQQVAALLEQAVVALAGRGLIPLDPTLTHRQILRQINQSKGEQGSMFKQLLHKAEPILFGNRPVDEQTLSGCWHDAQTLLGRQLA